MDREIVSDVVGVAALSVTTVVLFWLPTLFGV